MYTIKTIFYKKKFEYAKFLNEDIGFDADLNEGSDPVEVIIELNKMAEDAFKKLHPDIEKMRGTTIAKAGVRVLSPEEYGKGVLQLPRVETEIEPPELRVKLIPDVVTKKKLDNAVANGDIETFTYLVSMYDIKNEAALRKIVNTNIKIPKKK